VGGLTQAVKNLTMGASRRTLLQETGKLVALVPTDKQTRPK
jgi:hypothetical protein